MYDDIILIIPLLVGIFIIAPLVEYFEKRDRYSLNNNENLEEDSENNIINSGNDLEIIETIRLNPNPK